MGKKKKRDDSSDGNGAQKPKIFCFYCDRVFGDEKILIQHQKARHFKCHVCHKKLSTASGMVVHGMQVHKERITVVPNAKPGRDSVELEIFGMEGVPPEISGVAAAGDANLGPVDKRARYDGAAMMRPGPRGPVNSHYGPTPPMYGTGAGGAVPPGFRPPPPPIPPHLRMQGLPPGTPGAPVGIAPPGMQPMVPPRGPPPPPRPSPGAPAMRPPPPPIHGFNPAQFPGQTPAFAGPPGQWPPTGVSMPGLDGQPSATPAYPGIPTAVPPGAVGGRPPPPTIQAVSGSAEPQTQNQVQTPTQSTTSAVPNKSEIGLVFKDPLVSMEEKRALRPKYRYNPQNPLASYQEA